jgi:hypothetical protein
VTTTAGELWSELEAEWPFVADPHCDREYGDALVAASHPSKDQTIELKRMSDLARRLFDPSDFSELANDVAIEAVS